MFHDAAEHCMCYYSLGFASSVVVVAVIMLSMNIQFGYFFLSYAATVICSCGNRCASQVSDDHDDDQLFIIISYYCFYYLL